MDVTAKDIDNHRIRIEGPIDNTAGWAVSIRDLITGETIDNVSCLTITMYPNRASIARLVLVQVGEKVTEEMAEVHNPEVAFSAYVEGPND